MKYSRFIPWVWIIVLVIVGVSIFIPLMRSGFYISDDGEWMIIRLTAFYQSLAEGQFPVRFLGRLNNSYGYPVSNFLYPGFLYIGSVLHLVGFSFVNSVKVILASSVIITACFLYLFVRHWFKVRASLLAVISFLISPYLLYDLYHRGSVGEVLAFAPASALLYAVVSQSYWLVPLATALLIVSHNTLALILGSACLLFIVGRKDARVLLYGCMIGVGLSTFFWMPALFERHYTIFESLVISDPTQYFIGAQNLYLLGIPTVLAIGYVIWVRSQKDKDSRVFSILILCSYFFALPLSGVLWHIPILKQLVQFPYRFLSVSVLFGPWAVAYAYTHISDARRVISVGVIGVIWLLGAYAIMKPIDYVDRPEGYYTTNESTTTVHDEYLPRWAYPRIQKRSAMAFKFTSGDADAQILHTSTQLIDITADVSAVSVLEISKIYYPGWGVTIDGVRVPVSYENSMGLMRVTIPTGTHHVVASFRETIPRFLSDVLSACAGVMYLIMVLQKKRRI